MTANQTDCFNTNVSELRDRVQEINSRLRSVAAGELGGSASDQLGAVIGRLQQVSEQLAAMCGDPPGDLSERAFAASREREAKSEVDSGEFDMHG